jgi:hypothetical protein
VILIWSGVLVRCQVVGVAGLGRVPVAGLGAEPDEADLLAVGMV